MRGLELRRCPPSLCALWLSQRRRVRGSQHRWGRLAGRVTELTRCWISLEVHVSVGTRGMETHRKKGECRWTPNAEDSDISPEGVGTLLQRGRPERVAPSGEPIWRAYTLTGRELFQYYFLAGGHPRESGRNLYAV